MRTSLAHLIAGRPWAVNADSAMWHELHRLAQGREVEIDATAFEARANAATSFRERMGAQRMGAVEVIPVHSLITQRYTWLTWLYDGTSLEWLAEAIREAVEDSEVAAVVLDVDSPGGSVDGLIEFAAELRTMVAQKPIVAVTNPTNASAAFWASAGATEMVITPSGSIGSVGIYAMHVDESRFLEAEGVTVTLIHAGPYKVEGNPYEPLSEEARSTLQGEVDHFYRAFTSDVAKGRGTQVSTVVDAFGGGRMVMPAAAQAAGMVDRIATLADTVKRYQRGAAAAGTGRRAGELAPDIAAGEQPAADGSAAGEPETPPATEPAPPDPAWVALNKSNFDRRLREARAHQRSN